MMVTFISQCEKKALPRTRRVLDAFANRIGQNTWQTVITEDGLQAVKKLLRKTATKNTAVSCHWMRSRSRSEMIWVVGRKEAFNLNGYVPVNYTSKEVIMDKLNIETKKILANTKGQALSQHLFAVGYLAYTLVKKMGVTNEKLAQAAFIAGILHDIGKIDPQFQQWLLKKLKELTDEAKDESPLPDDGFHIDTSVMGYSKFSFEKHPRHHEISWLLATILLQDANTLNAAQFKQIYHGIYWHHTRPYRKENKSYFEQTKGIYKLLKDSLVDVSLDNLFDKVIAVMKDVKGMADNFKNADSIQALFPQWHYQFKFDDTCELPEYKIYCDIADTLEEYRKDIKINALHNLVRAAVISADRLVSAMSADDLEEYITEGTLANALDKVMLEPSNLGAHIEECLNGFESKFPNSERNQAQSQTVSALSKLKEKAEFNETAYVSVLQGPAGCGKTKIALEWAFKTNAQKIIWVCPRIQVCLGLLNDLTQADFLPNARIEILTGEHKKILTEGINLDDAPDTPDDEYFSGDIVITTIDQVINNIISHTKVDGLVDFMQAHVVFDEFHELIPMPAFNLLFAELIEVKKMRLHEANTLLVSATPHNYFVKGLLGLQADEIVRIKSFNESRYKIIFETYNDKENISPLITTPYSDGIKTFVITNTAQDAQLGFLHHQKNEKNVLLHSKYTKPDKTLWFNRVFNCFKRGGTGEFDVLRSGPIVQASLNISCDRMLTELTNAENWLQRLGRLDRFGVNKEPNLYTTVMPRSSADGKQNNRTARFLNSLCSLQSTVAWLSFLRDKLTDKETISLNELYAIYQDFYEDDQSKNKVAQDLQKALRESVLHIKANVIDPITFPPKSKLKQGVAKMSAHSLRGSNCFVQMAVCKMDENLYPVFLNEYAYDENTDHSKVTIGLTESMEKVQGGAFEMRESDKDLVSYMKRKHHNIMQAKYPEETFKAARLDWELLKQARSPEYPIYVSYTSADLEVIGGERERHPYAIYYVQTDKQPVGSMQLDGLTEKN